MEKNKKIIWGAITGIGAALLIPGAVMVSLNIKTYEEKPYVLTLSDTFSNNRTLLETYRNKLQVPQNEIFREGGFIDEVFVQTDKKDVDSVIDKYNEYVESLGHQASLRASRKIINNSWNNWHYDYTNVKNAINHLDFIPITAGIDTKFYGFCAMTAIGGLMFLSGGTVLGTKGAKKMANKLGIKQKLPKEDSETKTETK